MKSDAASDAEGRANLLDRIRACSTETPEQTATRWPYNASVLLYAEDCRVLLDLLKDRHAV